MVTLNMVGLVSLERVVQWTILGVRGEHTMPKYLTLGTLTQAGYDSMGEGPTTVEKFIDKINSMGGQFDRDDFYVLSGEYDWAAIVELPTEEAAAQVADIYARTGRGRMHSEVIVAQSPDGYEEYVDALVE